jgi:hypothetical protein
MPDAVTITYWVNRLLALTRHGGGYPAPISPKLGCAHLSAQAMAQGRVTYQPLAGLFHNNASAKKQSRVTMSCFSRPLAGPLSQTPAQHSSGEFAGMTPYCMIAHFRDDLM